MISLANRTATNGSRLSRSICYTMRPRETKENRVALENSSIRAAARWRRFRAIRSGNYARALDCAEEILLRNPWDLAAHLRMAQAFNHLNLLDLAIWTLEQVRPRYPNNPRLNRPLARLYEQRGNFN